MLAKQGGSCAICNSAKPGCSRKYFTVDHDHQSNKIRGLLCARCNPGLGFFMDQPELLRAAIHYLETHRA